MRSKWTLPGLAFVAAGFAGPAPAQTIAYINALQFDLQSFRNQATAGIFLDDVDKAADATRLLEVDGNRIFTNLSNLSDPALQGDRLITYSVTQLGNPTTGNVFDTGSFLGGWIGRTSDESDNVYSAFYQSNGIKTMFEDLEDFELGSGVIDGFDAELNGNILEQSFAGGVLGGANDNQVDAESQTLIDLRRFDDRTATDFDFGIAREINADLAVGGRFFYEEDELDRIAEGDVEFIQRERLGADLPSSSLFTTSRQTFTYTGPGEEAYQQSEIGVSLNADLHQWSDQSLNARVDVFRTKLTNPGAFTFSDDPTIDNVLGAQVNLVTNDSFVTVFGDQALNTQVGGGPYAFGDLINDHENRTTITSSFALGGGPGLATSGVDDERDGLGLGAKLEYDRECAGGDTRTWVAFLRKPYDIDASITQRQLVQSTFWWNGDGFGTPGDFEATLTSLDQTNSITRDGDLTWTTFEGGSRWTKDLSNTVSFGGGLVATRTKAAEEYTQRTETRLVSNRFDDGNANLGNNALAGSGFSTAPAGGSFVERQIVATSATTLDVNDEQKVTTLRIPVGLQFHFARKWAWNMGSLHEVNWLDRETSLATPVDAAGLQTVTTENFDGTLNQVETFGFDLASGNATVTDKLKTHTTTFYYGLEWDATENLSFYMNGMFDALGDGTENAVGGVNIGRQIGDVEFWRSLAISAKIIL